MAAAEHLCAAFARHFFRAADDAVQEYACQVLLSSIEDGEGLQAQADVLRDWLPPEEASAQALAAGLLELQRALQAPGEPHAFTWLRQQQPGQQPPEQQLACTAASSCARAAEGAATREAPAQQAPAGAAGEQQPAAAGGQGGGLRIAAAEFRPGGASASLSASLGSLQLGSGSSGVQACPGGAAEAGWGGAAGGGGGPPRAGWTAAAAAAEAAAAAGGGLAAAGPAAHAAFLAVLGEQFPLFSADALRQLFEEQGCDPTATVGTLCSLEAELEGQAAAGGWGGGGGAPAPGSPPRAAPSFSEADFPSLFPGSSSSSSAAGNAAGPASAAQYVSRARAAAQLPAQGSRSACAAAAPARAGAGAGPAPIWQQAEAVPQFATGAAAAAEYAALRADARDHARLRNAYFMQAAEAYLAGNRAAARELGAAGRWHNQQMHAAHAAAAERQFARRNPVPGGAACGAGAGGGVRVYDLHGLHVSEALAQVDALLAQHAQRVGGGARRLRIVVGVGSHGKVPSRLPAAVRRHLDGGGVRFSEPYSGLLEVEL